MTSIKNKIYTWLEFLQNNYLEHIHKHELKFIDFTPSDYDYVTSNEALNFASTVKTKIFSYYGVDFVNKFKPSYDDDKRIYHITIKAVLWLMDASICLQLGRFYLNSSLYPLQNVREDPVEKILTNFIIKLFLHGFIINEELSSLKKEKIEKSSFLSQVCNETVDLILSTSKLPILMEEDYEEEEIFESDNENFVDLFIHACLTYSIDRLNEENDLLYDP